MAIMRGLAACCALALCPWVCAATGASGTAPYELIVASLADTRTFRMSLSAVDKLLTPHCKKTSSDADAYDNRAEYACDKASGITGLKIDERKSSTDGNYILYLSMDFSAERYDFLKTQMIKQLGRPSKSGKHHAMWDYTADKKLNAIGYPRIMLLRDAATKDASFGVAVEADAGP